MNLAALSLRRPIFIACIVLVLILVGYISLRKLPVDLFPDVTIPVVVIMTTYEGAGPQEIETQISKPLEDAISTVAGIETLRSTNKEGVSTVVAEFDLGVQLSYAEQQIRDRVASAKNRLPEDVDDPVIRSVDPSDQPVLVISVTADMTAADLYDYANEVVKPQLTQVDRVGQIDVLGGRKREIHIELDRNKMRGREISAQQVSQQIKSAGRNVPVGKTDSGGRESVYRAVGEYRTLETIQKTIVRFTGNEVPVIAGDLGRVVDTLQDERSRTFVNGQQSVLLSVFRQSKANTIAVADGLLKKVEEINKNYANAPGKPVLKVVRDGSSRIRANVADVYESIIIGILLTILVVYFFLASGRSTLITSLALPNSLLGAFILMAIAGFSVNIMSLLALSLAVGLLVDDAIVVRENIFRHFEMGKPPHKAAYEGTLEVTLAVIATTSTVIAVFGPIGFLDGIVGQYLKEFGLTVCFAMLISLFDALTIAPMLSAYFAGKHHSLKDKKNFFLARWNQSMLLGFDRFQTGLENLYERLLHVVVRRPLLFIGASVALFVTSLFLLKLIPKTFLPPQDNGEFSINLDLPPGTSIDGMAELALKIEKLLLQQKDVETTVTTIGGRDGESNVTEIFVKLVPSKKRSMNTSQYKDRVREWLKPYAHANPQVGDGAGGGGGGQRPFNVNIVGTDLKQIEDVSTALLQRMKDNPALKDVDTSYRPGKPEIQVKIDERRAQTLGVATATLGGELRAQIQGETPAVYRKADREYDVRVRMQPDQRNLKENFAQIMVPNINNTLVPIAAVAQAVETTGPATILRQDRARYIQISGDVAPKGPGMGGAIADAQKFFSEYKLPAGVSYAFVGQSKRFAELLTNMAVAMGLGILFIYFVLCSLYESFVTPFAIMLVFPLAACGAFFALFITGSSLDLFSMIGCVMLLGLATKNSILIVDYTNQLISYGLDRQQALIRAGKTRLRPILMTSFALIAGMVPVAIGLNEASKQRTSMGIAIIGGTISSTLLSLIVVPAAFAYIDRFRAWSSRLFFSHLGSKEALDALEEQLQKEAKEKFGELGKEIHPSH